MAVMTDAERDRILFLIDTIEMKKTDAAREVGYSNSAIGRVKAFYDAAKAGGVDGVIECGDRMTRPGEGLLWWALSRAGVKVTDADRTKISEAIARWSRADKEKDKRNKTNDVPPNVEVVYKDEPRTDSENDLIAFMKLVQKIEILNSQNMVIIETLKNGFDAVADAIAALAGDIKDNTNLNSDLVCERLKEQTDILTGIKMNTRKRGL